MSEATTGMEAKERTHFTSASDMASHQKAVVSDQEAVVHGAHTNQSGCAYPGERVRASAVRERVLAHRCTLANSPLTVVSSMMMW